MSTRLIQDLHAGISRRDWSAVETAANALLDESDKVRRALAATDFGSLPADYPTLSMVEDRMEQLSRCHPAPQTNTRADLYDADAFMADGGATPMTAAEAVLAWLLIEKIGVPDDVCYSPDQAQEIIVRRLDLARELEEIDAMLSEGQGDDEGYPIMPEFVKGMTTYAKVEACLHLLERRRDALHPSPETRVRGCDHET